MATCPDCGNVVDVSKDFCKNCGASIEDVEELESDKIFVHIENKENKMKCNSVTYSQQGTWTKIRMMDGTVRLYPQDKIDYIQAPRGLDKLTSVNVVSKTPEMKVRKK
jgi:DNA-directed RNA polymerase subunit M/transcription elongation factor TFIIS